jgi:hypothetical protein
VVRVVHPCLITFALELAVALNTGKTVLLCEFAVAHKSAHRAVRFMLTSFGSRLLTIADGLAFALNVRKLGAVTVNCGLAITFEMLFTLLLKLPFTVKLAVVGRTHRVLCTTERERRGWTSPCI